MEKSLDFYRDKTVTVTGATGLIGSYVVKVLNGAGACVKAVYHDRKPNAFTRLANEIHRANLFSPDEARRVVRGSEVVINAAGVTGGVGFALADPISYVGPATTLVINVLNASYLEKVRRFGLLSSTTVYPSTDTPVREADFSMASEPYPLYEGISWSKRFLEKLCQYYQKRTGLESGIVRPTGAYGRYDDFDESSSHVVPGMIVRALKLKKGENFEVWGDGLDVRDIIHAEDVARGFLLTVAYSATSDAVNLASGIPMTTLEMARSVLQIVGSDAKIVTNPSKPTAIRSRTVNVEKAKSLFGFEPQVSFREGIEDTIEWLGGPRD